MRRGKQDHPELGVCYVTAAPGLYHAYGMTVRSALELPEFAPGEGEVDIDISFGGVPHELENPLADYPLLQARTDQVLLREESIGRVSISEGKFIVWDRAENADDRYMRDLLVGFCFGILFFQRGHLPLHASSVVKDDRALVLAGHSGSGKSTLAAKLVGRGFSLLSDDVSAIRIIDGVACVAPGFPSFKLLDQSLELLGMADDDHSENTIVSGKTWVRADSTVDRQVPLGTIVVLHPRGKGEPRLKAIEGRDRMTVIKRFTYRKQLESILKAHAKLFPTCVSTATSVPMYVLERSPDGAPLSCLADMVEEVFSARAGACR